MTLTSVHKDTEAMTMTITSSFEAPVERVWELWDDPRQLERWWGPPTWPATFEEHTLVPGGWVSYFMTGPEGDKAHGWWKVISAEAPHRLEFEDGFADEAGKPNPDMPVMVIRVAIDAQPDGTTQMAVETTFPSPAAMDQMISMGMEEGMSAALGQIDDMLAADVRS